MILVFASKQVGFDLVPHLMEVETPIAQLIVGRKLDQKLFNLALSKSIPIDVYNKKIQAKLFGLMYSMSGYSTSGAHIYCDQICLH